MLAESLGVKCSESGLASEGMVNLRGPIVELTVIRLLHTLGHGFTLFIKYLKRSPGLPLGGMFYSVTRIAIIN